MASILHLAHAYYPTVGGTSTRLQEMFRKSRHQHTIVCLRCVGNTYLIPKSCPLDETLDNVRVLRINYPKTPNLAGLAGMIVRRDLRSQILHYVRRDQFDIVHGHSPLILGRVSFSISRFMRRPFLYEYHQVDYPWLRRPVLLSAARKHLRWHRENMVVKNSRLVIVQTQMQRERLSQTFSLPHDRFKVLRMGVDTEKFHSNIVPAISSRAPNQRVRFCLCGNLSRVWGVAVVLEVFRNLPNTLSDKVELVVCGRGELSAEVCEAAKAAPDHIRWLGEIPWDKMPEVYAHVDYLIVHCLNTLTWSENTPTKILEAMAMGIGIITTAVRGVLNVLGDHGFYFAPGDPTSLCVAISEAVERSTQSGMKARLTSDEITRRFSWDPVRQEMDTIHSELLQ